MGILQPTAVFLNRASPIYNIFGLVVAQEAANHCDKAVLGLIFVPIELGELCALKYLFSLWSSEDNGFDLCLIQPREDISKVLEGCRLQSRAVVSFKRLSFMCIDGNSTFGVH